MVDKLGLKTEYHPEPYQLTWLKKGKTKHDGFHNTYNFYKDGVNITLVSLDTRKFQENDYALYLKQIEVEEVAKITPLMFVLVVEEANELAPLVHVHVQPLLSEFSDVTPDDIPLGLPIMQDIQHCIDFILGSAVPNKPAYRMNTKEYEELYRQVEELVEKGLIRESMSPCEVHALLVPKG
ncbi:hypothetical protein Tco_1158281 [Tanacetum coccineum]